MLRNDARNDRRRRTAVRRGFTLVEMLVVVTILGLLSGMVLVALAGAAESAREARTRSQIAKLNEFIMNKYESYRTRRTPRPTTSAADLLKFDVDTNGRYSPFEIQRARVENIRALMIQEMPDRKTDLATYYGSLSAGAFTATYARHQRAILAFKGLTPNAANWAAAYGGWSADNQHAECLYLILASINDGDTSAIDFLHDSEVGDTDGDGIPEVLDGWGNPVAFIRWPQGFIGFESSLQDIRTFDSFDPLRTRTPIVNLSTVKYPTPHPLDPAPTTPTTFFNFNLTPLVVSAGKDGVFDIGADESTVTNADEARGILYVDAASAGPINYVPSPPGLINPYLPSSGTGSTTLIDPNNNSIYGVGTMFDVNRDGYDNSIDNISSHYLVVGGNAP